ncbi:MAG: anti-sigma factor family protein [bacterium]
MKCRKIQTLLLTDYLDHEIREALQHKVEDHVNHCLTCRQFERALKKTAAEPFHHAEKIKVPDSIWAQIKEAIALEEKEKAKGFFPELRVTLQRISAVPKTVCGLITMAIAVLFMVIAVYTFQSHHQRPVIIAQERQIEYLTSVMEDSEYFSTDENGDYNTAIEEYFL